MTAAWRIGSNPVTARRCPTAGGQRPALSPMGGGDRLGLHRFPTDDARDARPRWRTVDAAGAARHWAVGAKEALHSDLLGMRGRNHATDARSDAPAGRRYQRPRALP